MQRIGLTDTKQVHLVSNGTIKGDAAKTEHMPGSRVALTYDDGKYFSSVSIHGTFTLAGDYTYNSGGGSGTKFPANFAMFLGLSLNGDSYYFGSGAKPQKEDICH